MRRRQASHITVVLSKAALSGPSVCLRAGGVVGPGMREWLGGRRIAGNAREGNVAESVGRLAELLL